MPFFLNLKKQNLKTLDVLVYISIRSFHNSTTGQCYPPYEKIMERSGLSRGFIAGSITRLENAGYFKVIHSNRKGTCNQYQFHWLEDMFNPVPYELFTASDLTSYEKAMLLCLRPFFINNLLVCISSIKSVAKELGLSYKQVYSPYKALIEKGYIKEVYKVPSKCAVKGILTIYLIGKIDWAYDYLKPLPKKVMTPNIGIMVS